MSTSSLPNEFAILFAHLQMENAKRRAITRDIIRNAEIADDERRDVINRAEIKGQIRKNIVRNAEARVRHGNPRVEKRV